MTKNAFTDLFLRKIAPPSEGRVEHYDGKVAGFGVRISKSGRKTFFVVGRQGKAFRRVSLGHYPELTLEQARRKAHDTLRSLADGSRSTGSEIDSKPGATTFEDAVVKFIDTHCALQNRPSTAAETARLLRSVFVARWRNTQLVSIGKNDVLHILDELMAAGTPSAARHAFAAVRKFFNWCVERGVLLESPCLSIKPPAKATSRDRVLNDGELVAVLAGAEKIGWPFGPIVQLLVFTAQRRGEVVGMRWSEIDEATRQWDIPGSRTKNHRSHVVPLTSSALAILKQLPRLDASPLVFPARGFVDRPYSGYSKGKRELDAVCEQRGWTLHDLRRTVATGMAREGVAPHVVERLLNHVSGTFGGVAGIYNRFGYLDEMRAALEQWERRIEVLRGAH
ncbi:MAG: tyrosine-type recombinase/integrase [Hyphomicrobium sp.]